MSIYYNIPFDGHLYPNEEYFRTNTKIMNRILEQLSAMFSYHSRLIVIRIDLHPKRFTHDNDIMSDFILEMKSWLTKHYGLKRVGYVWVREIGARGKKQHYHFVWMLDQSKVKHSNTIMEQSDQCWEAITGGSNHKPKNCYSIVKRGNHDETMAECIKRLSYLAKEKTKVRILNGDKLYSTSRIKSKEGK